MFRISAFSGVIISFLKDTSLPRRFGDIINVEKKQHEKNT